jgi:hypothetical protein
MPGKESLASAGLTQEQHRRIGFRDMFNLSEGRSQGWTVSDDLARVRPRGMVAGRRRDALLSEAFRSVSRINTGLARMVAS